MSLPEVLLWRELRGKRPKIRRQFPVAGYVADFACAEARLIVEVDGFAHDTDDRAVSDERRTRALTGKGWRVVRIAAARVLADPGAVAEAVLRLAEDARPLHHPR
jgi:very-short-patch-repair endonuclease